MDAISASPVQTAAGEAFPFGANWRRFLESVDETRITAAVDSLTRMLGAETLAGASFLDGGCGSGLFSLAAARLGARVRSFDVDPQSVMTTREIRRRFGPQHADWDIGSGSLLDEDFLAGLGEFDVVYSWGVVHHTGEMWRAIDLLRRRVAPGGLLWLAIYNDQGTTSRVWKRIKRGYIALPRWLRTLYVLLVGGAWAAWRLATRLAMTGAAILFRLLTLRNPMQPASTMYGDFFRSSQSRGMHRWYDLVDWIGGWPFEVARPEEVFDFLRERGFELIRLKTCGGSLGCNEFVFQRRPND